MAKKTSRRNSAPIPLPVQEEPVNCPMPEPACPMPVNLSAVPMASLGTPTVSGPNTAETGVTVSLTVACFPKTENAVLTWEGVGCDIFGADTGGLTGDQDHDETINLVFNTPGSYVVKAGYSDEGADNSPQYSSDFTVVITAPVEPEPEVPGEGNEDDGFGTGKLGDEAHSLAKIFEEKYRPISVEPAGDGISFDVKRVASTDQPEPNEGEMDWFLKWLSFHFSGQITDSRNSGYFRLTLDSKDARVIPGGGAKPSRIITE